MGEKEWNVYNNNNDNDNESSTIVYYCSGRLKQQGWLSDIWINGSESPWCADVNTTYT